MTGIERYDAFELSVVVEYRNADGESTYCESLGDDSDTSIKKAEHIVATDDFALRYFFSVYGHIPEGGVECFSDGSQESATLIYSALVGMLNAHTVANRRAQDRIDYPITPHMQELRTAILNEVQHADEMYGAEGPEEYVGLMDALLDDITLRRSNAMALILDTDRLYRVGESWAIFQDTCTLAELRAANEEGLSHEDWQAIAALKVGETFDQGGEAVTRTR